MSAKSATVEVLIAEVRVLQVGSRQVTLSVFRQLDFVHYDECQAFGRVNDDVRNYNNDRYVIGREVETGVLVRARFPYRKRPAWTTQDERDLKNDHDQVKFYQKQLQESNFNRAWHEKKLKSYQEEAYYLQEEKDKIPEKQKRYDEALATFNALPLIVLAGLK